MIVIDRSLHVKPTWFQSPLVAKSEKGSTLVRTNLTVFVVFFASRSVQSSEDNAYVAVTGNNIPVVTISTHKDAAERRVAPLPPVSKLRLLGRVLARGRGWGG